MIFSHFDPRAHFSSVDFNLVNSMSVLPDTYKVMYKNLSRLALGFQFIKDDFLMILVN